MSTSDSTRTSNRRQDSRAAMSEEVTITFSQEAIVGPGQNISTQGLFFVAKAAIPVTVRIRGVSEPVRGELVRVQAMAEGSLGVAVRFLDPVPDLSGL